MGSLIGVGSALSCLDFLERVVRLAVAYLPFVKIVSGDLGNWMVLFDAQGDLLLGGFGGNARA